MTCGLVLLWNHGLQGRGEINKRARKHKHSGDLYCSILAPSHSSSSCNFIFSSLSPSLLFSLLSFPLSLCPHTLTPMHSLCSLSIPADLWDNSSLYSGIQLSQWEYLWLWWWLPGSPGVTEGTLRTHPGRLDLLLQFSDAFLGPLGPMCLCLRPICAFRQSHCATDWAWIAAEASFVANRSVGKPRTQDFY